MILPEEIAALHGLRHRTDLLARRRPRARPAGHDRRHAEALRLRRPRANADLSVDAAGRRGTRCESRALIIAAENNPRALRRRALQDVRRSASEPTNAPPCSASPAPAAPASLADRRTRAPLLARLRRQAHRRALRRSDPRKTGGALLGDRIRMNAIRDAARLHALAGDPQAPTSRCPARRRRDRVSILQAAGFDLIVLETLGHRPVRHGDHRARRPASLYVMTPEYGAAEPAREDRHARLRRPRRAQQVRPPRRARRAARRAQAGAAQPQGFRGERRPTTMPVFGTMASQFNDPGTNRSTGARHRASSPRGRRAQLTLSSVPLRDRPAIGARATIIPPERVALPRRDRRRPSAATNDWAEQSRQARARRASSTCSRRARSGSARSRRDGGRPRRAETQARPKPSSPTSTPEPAARRLAGRSSRRYGSRRVVYEGARKEIRPAQYQRPRLGNS